MEIIRVFKNFQTNREVAAVAAPYMTDLGLTAESLKDKQVLDMGAGSGAFEKYMGRKGVSVTSVDKSPGDYYPQKVFTDKIVEADSRTLPFKDASFDTVIGHQMIHHAVGNPDDLSQIIKETMRVLKPGGELRFDINDNNIQLLAEQLEIASDDNTLYENLLGRLSHLAGVSVIMESIDNKPRGRRAQVAGHRYIITKPEQQ